MLSLSLFRQNALVLVRRLAKSNAGGTPNGENKSKLVSRFIHWASTDAACANRQTRADHRPRRRRLPATGRPLLPYGATALPCQGIVWWFSSWLVSLEHAWPSSRAGLRLSGRHARSPLLQRLRRRRLRSRSPQVPPALCSGRLVLVGRA